MSNQSSSSSILSDVVKETLLQRAISSSSVGGGGGGTSIGNDTPDGRRSFGTAMFKMAAVKSLRMKKQSKLNLEHVINPQQDVSILNSNTEQPEYEEQSNEEFLRNTPQNSIGVEFQDPTDGELQKACRVALTTFFDLSVFHSDKENGQSLKYIEQLFSKIASYEDQLLRIRNEANKARKIAIKCELLRGNGLPARDADGKSDPYCKMVILDKQHIHTKATQKGDITSWIEDGLIEKKNVVQSTVRPSTLEPEWNNELFELELKNPEEEFLVIEVWDSDEEDHKKKIKGFKGFGKFLQDLSHQDDFMGRAFYLLKHLPLNGEERQIELFSHSGKHTRGTITMKMNIIEKGKVFQTEDEKFNEYKELLKVVLAHESKEDGHYIRRWNGELSEAGRALLANQVSLRGLSKLREASMHFSLLMDYHKSYAISMSALRIIIDRMKNFDSELKQAQSTGTSPDWVYKLLREVKELYTDIICILKIHLERFSLKSEADIKELREYLVALKSIYSSQSLFPTIYDTDSFVETVKSAIQGAVPTWFLILSANLMPTLSSTNDRILALKALCSHCLKQCHRVLTSVQPVFMEEGIDYFSPFFYSFDKLLYAEAESVLSICNEESGQLMCYEIFRVLHDLKPFAEYMDKEFLLSQNTAVLYISMYHKWFKGFVSIWFELAQSKAKERLHNAVELDTVANYTDQACFSSSAVDAHGMFIQVVNFWKDIDWPDREQSVGYFAKIVQNISDLAMYYADLVTQKVTLDYYTDENGHVIITDKLCITLNNIQHVKGVLADIGESLDLKTYYKFLDEESTDNSLSTRTEALRLSILSSADEDIQEKKNSIVRRVHELVVPEVTRLFTVVMEADDKLPSETAIEPLLDYIAKNMGKLGEALLTPNFLAFLEQLWYETTKMLHDQFDRLTHKSSTMPQFFRLKDLATTLTDFFEAGGNGLSRKQMETPSFLILLRQITISSMTTQQLIRVFLQDIVKQQQEAPANFGVLRFSHLYHEGEKVMRINVVSAEGIPALDKTGKSDPFVVVHLLPSDLFPKLSEKHFKTDIKKQTLDPFFNEKFDLPLEESYKLKEEGAVILLAMFDWDKIGRNDFAGICVVSTSTTPQGTELKMEHLNLFHYKQTLAYREIERRSSENLAHDFLKMMKKFVYDEDNVPSSPSHNVTSRIKRLTTFGKAGHD